jgi:two-component system, sensor histidine kinase and response regulator
MASADAVIPGSYDFLLVALSVLVAISASYVALDLAERVTATEGSPRMAWLFCGAAAMGTGIWSMHFTGMLAFRLFIPVVYHWPTVLFSFVIAATSSAVSLYVVSRPKLIFARAIASGVAMGLGIAAMHYTGMAAMRMAAVTRFDPWFVTVSVLLAILNSLAGLWLAFRFRAETKIIAWRKIGSGTVMGAAIWIMHYTGMSAASFIPSSMPQNLSRTVSIGTLGCVGISAVSLFVLFLAIWSSSVDRRIHKTMYGLILEALTFTERRKRLEEEARQELEANYRSLVERSPSGIFRSTPDGRLLTVNPALVRMLGYDSETELLRANLARDVYVDPSEREKTVELYSNAHLIQVTEPLWKTKDGRQIKVRVNGQSIVAKASKEKVFEEIVEETTATSRQWATNA